MKIKPKTFRDIYTSEYDKYTEGNTDKIVLSNDAYAIVEQLWLLNKVIRR